MHLFTRIHISLALAILSSIGIAPTTPQPTTPIATTCGGVEPITIYDHARQFLINQAYPRYASYTVAVAFISGGHLEQNHYKAQIQMPEGIVRVHSTSLEELANPVNPHGVKFEFVVTVGGQSDAIPLNPDPPQDPFGIPLLSPSYTFGLTPVHHVDGTGGPQASALSAFPVITTVLARDRIYEISCDATDQIGQHKAYHLELHPLRDPKKYRIREMWVDATSYATLQVRTDGNFCEAPEVGVPWLITFKETQGIWYLDTETAEKPLRYSKNNLYPNVTVSFQNIQPLNTGLLEFSLEQLPLEDILDEPDTIL